MTTGMMGLVSSMPAFLALRFTGGAASAFVLVLASALVLDRLASARRPHLAQVHFAGVGTGIAASALIVSLSLAAGFGWRALWYGVGAVAVSAMVVVVLARAASDGSRSRGERGTELRQRRRGLGALICAYGLFGFGYIVTATFLVAIVRGSPQIRAAEPLVWLVVGLTAMRLGRPVGKSRVPPRHLTYLQSGLRR